MCGRCYYNSRFVRRGRSMVARIGNGRGWLAEVEILSKRTLAPDFRSIQLNQRNNSSCTTAKSKPPPARSTQEAATATQQRTKRSEKHHNNNTMHSSILHRKNAGISKKNSRKKKVKIQVTDEEVKRSTESGKLRLARNKKRRAEKKIADEMYTQEDVWKC